MSRPQGLEAIENAPLAPYTTFRIGGPADWLLLPRGRAELAAALAWAAGEGLPLTPLGGGSNVLVSDEGVAGAVVVLGAGLDELEMTEPAPGRAVIRAGAGLRTGRLVNLAAEKGLLDLAFLAGLPGTLGGAAAVNAGDPDEAMDKVILNLEMLDPSGRPRKVAAGEVAWGYRAAKLPAGVVVGLEMQSRLAPPAEVAQMIRDRLERRRQSQPLDMPSAGSFFKNPPGDFAGRVIEAAGLKGLRVGQAEVSRKHANWIVNLGRATAAEVLALAGQVRGEVLARFGLALEPEVRFLGRGRETWPWQER